MRQEAYSKYAEIEINSFWGELGPELNTPQIPVEFLRFTEKFQVDM